MLRCVVGNTFPIVGTGTLRLSPIWEGGGLCELMNAVHVPDLSHYLLTLRRIADAGNKYIGNREGIRIFFAKSGDELFAPSYGQLNIFLATALIGPVKKSKGRNCPGGEANPINRR